MKSPFLSDALHAPLRESLIVTFAAALIYLLRLLYLEGGAIHMEAISFLRVYTDGRPFWETIYNPVFNDWIMYQPRELSYFFDWLDAHWIVFWIRHGFVLFYSPSCFAAALGTVFLQQYGARKCYPALDGRLITLVSLIYILLPLTTACYYRSAKPLTAFFLTGACFLAVRLFSSFLKISESRRTELLLLFFCLFFMNVSDRQGAFFVAVFASLCGFLLLISWKIPVIRNRKLLLQMAAGSWGIVLFGLVYNWVISPSLVYALNGYLPDFDYQYSEGGDIFAFAGGFEFVFSGIGLFFTGAFSRWGIAAGGVCLFLLFLTLLPSGKKGRIGWNFRFFPAFLFLSSGMALIACANVMSVKCSAILDQEALIAGSYATPMIALLVCFLFYTLSRVSRDPGRRKIWTLILIASLAGQTLFYFPLWDGMPVASKALFFNTSGTEVGLLKFLLAHPGEEYRKYPLSYRSVLLIRQMRGLPPFEDENRFYYYYRLYQGKRI